jgi:magnesium transporter
MEIPSRLALSFLCLHPEETAEILERLPVGEIRPLLHSLHPSVLASVLGPMNPVKAGEILHSFPLHRAATTLESMKPPEAASILRSLTKKRVEEILRVLPLKKRKPIRSLLKFPNGLVGAAMEPVEWFYELDLPAGEVVGRFRRFRENTGLYIYITDADRKLVGMTDLKTVLRVNRSHPLRDFMETGVVSIPAQLSQAAARALPAWEKFSELPVVETDGILVGVLKLSELIKTAGQKTFTDDGPNVFEMAAEVADLYVDSLTEFLRVVSDLSRVKPRSGM